MPKLTFTFPDGDVAKYALPLNMSILSIGRQSSGNDLRLDHPSISAHHAQIKRISGGFEIIDLHSTNGTRENGASIFYTTLKDASSYSLGDIRLHCEFSPLESVELAQEIYEHKSFSSQPTSSLN